MRQLGELLWAPTLEQSDITRWFNQGLSFRYARAPPPRLLRPGGCDSRREWFLWILSIVLCGRGAAATRWGVPLDYGNGMAGHAASWRPCKRLSSNSYCLARRRCRQVRASVRVCEWYHIHV